MLVIDDDDSVSVGQVLVCHLEKRCCCIYAVATQLYNLLMTSLKAVIVGNFTTILIDFSV